ncbi:MAG TPA: M28 family peptidase [Gemmatimonadota bacterium]|nr:M28 family peptidase [Gemmatimonadota bacterium]
MTRRPFPRSGRVLAACALAALAAAGCKSPSTIDGVNVSSAAARQGMDGIDSTSIRARTSFLASDFTEGRAPGTRGGRLAAEYIATEFRALGLEPGADTSYYQRVPFVGVTPHPDLTFTSADGRSRYTPGYLDDFVAWTGRQEGQVDFAGDLVFVGYGVTAPEYGWDDYDGADVKGKILVGLVNDPGGTGGSEKFRGDTLTYYGRWTYKYEEAARRGAAGLILVHTPASAGYGWSVVSNSWSGEQFEIPNDPGEYHLALQAWVTEAAARRMLGLAGVSLDSLTAAAKDPGFTARPLPLRAEGDIRSDIERIQSANVVARLPGRDSALRDQVVVYTSHYDHLGIGTPEDGDAIYNGAKDNASGTAAIIELAKAYREMDARPRRTVLFAAVTGEESGLLGSAYLARHPLGDRHVADINMDAINMYGRTKDMVQLGGEYSTLGRIFADITRYMGLEARGDQSPGQGHFFRSDQFSFVQQGVPSIYIEEGRDYAGLPEGTGREREEAYRSERYHQPDDEMLPDYTMGGAAQQARVAFLVGWVAANAEQPPAWAPGSPFGSPGPAADSGAASPADSGAASPAGSAEGGASGSGGS